MGPLAALSTPSLAVLAGLLGLLIGSFLNVVVHRLPHGASLLRPGSHCPRCRRPVAPWENVPILSFLWLRGRCRGCGERISWRYPFVEALTGLLFAALALRLGAVPLLPVALAFAASLLAAALIDFDHRVIPDSISLGGLALALAVVPAARWLGGVPLTEAVLRSLAGALLGGGLLWVVGFSHARVSVASGRVFEHWPGEGEALPRPGSLDYWVWFPGIGFGDVKLLAMIGAVLGPTGALATIVLASLLGLLLGGLWALATRRLSAPFGFGPAIAAGALAVLLAPEDFFVRALRALL